MSMVALVQMRSCASVLDNLHAVERLLQKASEQGAQLVLLPENFAFMGQKENDKWQMAEVYGQGAIQDQLSRWAKQWRLWLVAGTLPLKTSGKKVRASSLVYDDQGVCVARYDKIHLFDVWVNQDSYQESQTIERGDKLVVLDTPVGKLGLSVCYDLRFPELYLRLMQAGAQLFTVPSAFTATTGAAHWEILLRARAIENTCYVLAANQGGLHENGRSTYGHSMVVDPWGKVLAEHNTVDEGLVMASIDLQLLRTLRKTFPSVAHHVLT